MPPAPSTQSRYLSRGLHAISCAAAVALNCGNIFLVLNLGNFEQIFADLYGGHPLPAITQFLLAWRTFFLTLSMALPVCALLASCLTCSRRQALIIVGAVYFITLVQIIFTFLALFSPLVGTISGMHDAG